MTDHSINYAIRAAFKEMADELKYKPKPRPYNLPIVQTQVAEENENPKTPEQLKIEEICKKYNW